MSRHLLFVAPSAYPLGGVADWLDYLLRGLSDRGWKCTLGLVSGRHHDVARYLRKHPWEGVIVVECPTGSREGRVAALSQVIQSANPDIAVVVNIADAYEAVRRLRVRRHSSTRLVTALHGLQYDLLADIEAERGVIDAVVATNRLTQRLAIDALGAPERVPYAPYGVPVRQRGRDPVVDEDSQCPNGLVPSRSLRILYSGRLENDQKRVQDLPKILSALRRREIDASLTIAGSGDSEGELESDVRARGLEAHVRFMGTLGRDDLALQYKVHDALIITSSWETGPIVAWEAMSNGLPVVTSRYLGCGLENALVHGRNCLMFEVANVEEAAACLETIRFPATRAGLARGGWALVNSRYSEEASIEKWSEALDRVSALPELSATGAPGGQTISSGRLDRLLGPSKAEVLRRVLRRRFPHTGAGGEWPHSLHSGHGQTAWLSELRTRDVSEDSGR